MAAMVGGATGAAMTAVTMIFEMTRDYDIVMPMIVAVALSIGIRRVLSPRFKNLSWCFALSSRWR
jgi:chloride channel protein, CIC family